MSRYSGTTPVVTPRARVTMRGMFSSRHQPTGHNPPLVPFRTWFTSGTSVHTPTGVPSTSAKTMPSSCRSHRRSLTMCQNSSREGGTNPQLRSHALRYTS